MKNLKQMIVRTAAAFLLLTSAILIIETKTEANTVQASDGLCGVMDAACVSYALNHGYNGVTLTGYNNCDRNFSATNVPRGYHGVVYVSGGAITGVGENPPAL